MEIMNGNLKSVYNEPISGLLLYRIIINVNYFVLICCKRVIDCGNWWKKKLVVIFYQFYDLFSFDLYISFDYNGRGKNTEVHEIQLKCSSKLLSLMVWVKALDEIFVIPIRRFLLIRKIVLTICNYNYKSTPWK